MASQYRNIGSDEDEVGAVVDVAAGEVRIKGVDADGDTCFTGSGDGTTDVRDNIRMGLLADMPHRDSKVRGADEGRVHARRLADLESILDCFSAI